MKAVAKWVTIVWSMICLIGLFSGLAEVGKDLGRPMTEAEEAGAGIGIGCGMGLWVAVWLAIAGPAAVIYAVSGKKEAAPQVAAQPQKAPANLCKECGKYYEGVAEFCPNCGKPTGATA